MGQITLFKVPHKEELAHFFSPQSVGSSFIVGGMRWGKNPFEILSSSIQPEEGSTWFYKGSVLFQKASLARRASSSIAGTWQPAFVLPSLETWMPYFLQHDGVLLYLVLRGWDFNIVLLSEACSHFFLWTSCLTNTSAAFFPADNTVFASGMKHWRSGSKG